MAEEGPVVIDITDDEEEEHIPEIGYYLRSRRRRRQENIPEIDHDLRSRRRRSQEHIPMVLNYHVREEWATESEEEEGEEEGYTSESEGEAEEESEEEEEEEGEEEEGYIMESEEVHVDVQVDRAGEGEEQQEREEEGEDIMEPESEGEEEEEEAEQLEEMRGPVVTSWMGQDGITVHGIICIDDGVIRLMNQCKFDDCSICYKPSTARGKHQICCLPCGHMYGLSCIKNWLLFNSNSGKCPRCKTLCSFKDARLLYPLPLCPTAHQKASSAEFFSFTEQGLLKFKEYENSRMCDARFLRDADEKHMNILETKRNDLASRMEQLAREQVNLLEQAKLEPRVKALRRRIDALERLVNALRRRMDALKRRADAFESRVNFYLQMYKEYHEREEEIAAKVKNKGEEEAGSIFQFIYGMLPV